MKMLDHALEYAAQGIAVFPCLPSKAPAIEGGFHSASTDKAQIEEWWGESGDEWLIGAAVPEDIFILDVDPRNGGSETIRALVKQGRTFPKTKQAKTGGGGYHYWYGLPTEHSGAALKALLGKGVDVKRHDKGYVIVPPSTSEQGEYTWLTGEQPAEAPQWMLDALLRETREKRAPVVVKQLPEGEQGTPYALEALRCEVLNLKSAQRGERNDALNKSAFSVFQLVHGGELGEVYAATELAEAAYFIGLSRGEIEGTLRSAYDAASHEPRTAPVEETFVPLVADDSEEHFWTRWDVDEPAPPFYLYPILPKNSYIVVYGATEAAKSMAWNGILAQGSHVGLKSSVYSLENPAHVDRNRLKRLDPDPENFRLSNQPLDLSDVAQIDALVKREKAWGTDVILLDTYSHAFQSKSEDGNGKAIKFAQVVRHIMHEVGCSLIVIDHTGYENRLEPRDASAKRQQVDVAIFMEREGSWQKGRAARFTMTNNKAARMANPFEGVRGAIVDTENDGLKVQWADSDFGSRWEV